MPSAESSGLGFRLNHETSDIFVMFLLQVLLFWVSPSVASASLMTIVTFVVFECYGGGFAPSQRSQLIILVRDVGPI